MRASLCMLATMKETPNDAEVISHQYMLRAGFIRKLGSGLYSWLPLGLKTLRKVEKIVREEMNRSGALEVLLPAVQPAELWQETGRWSTFGNQLLKMRDNNDREYCFGPTHEEVITDIMRNELNSYKQLPINLYQIQTKFRDEIRPRFGVMRAREFIMKDAYSFHVSQASLQTTYDAMYQAYCRIFDRMGLHYRAVEADTGAIGGSASHEFQVLAQSGEDVIFYSNESTYAANVEQATSLPSPAANKHNGPAVSLIATPGKQSIEEVTDFLQITPGEMIKTLIVEGNDPHPLVALVLKGDDVLNEVKASKHPLVKHPLTLAKEELLVKHHLPTGYLGPINLALPVIVDHQALSMPSFTCGANQIDHHYQHGQWTRDVEGFQAYDLRTVKEGDKSPDGKGILHACRGIEVGHVFQLGEKYARSMGATVLNEQGKNETVLMGCYGLGISRVVAAAIEQHHDEKGIIWPQSIAPFEVVIIPINFERAPAVQLKSEELYHAFLQAGLDVLLDDRPGRPGSLFADHDLIGIPHRVVISEKLLDNQCIEYKRRGEEEVQMIPLEKLKTFMAEVLMPTPTVHSYDY